MKKMKKFLALILSLAMIASLAGLRRPDRTGR